VPFVLILVTVVGLHAAEQTVRDRRHRTEEDDGDQSA
jgi:hypothetical protein